MLWAPIPSQAWRQTCTSGFREWLTVAAENIVWSHFLQENIQDNNKENSVLLRGAQLYGKRRCFEVSIPLHVDRGYISVVQEGETGTRQMPMANQRSSTNFECLVRRFWKHVSYALHLGNCGCTHVHLLVFKADIPRAGFNPHIRHSSLALLWPPIPHSSKDSLVTYLPDKTQTNYNYSSVKNKQLFTRTAHSTRFYSTCMTPNYNIYNNCLHMANPHCGS